jgi:hypothetical protein
LAHIIRRLTIDELFGVTMPVPHPPATADVFPLHREVEWFERYAPPEPGYVLADEVWLAQGTRLLLVWRPRSQPRGHMDICCWTAPQDPGAPWWARREAPGLDR